METLSPWLPELTRKYAGIWHALPAEIPDGLSLFSQAEQSERQQRVEELIHEVENSSSPAGARGAIRRFVAELDEGEIGSLRNHSGDFSEASKEFAERGWVFDRSISEEEMLQAFRNFWLFNALQLMFTGRVSFQPGAFAYSLLYPYTDNFFDDPRVRTPRKKAFGAWVSRCLSGDASEAADRLAGKVTRLVRLIEEEYPRRTHPLVFEGLHGIHNAQMGALEESRDDLVQGIVWRSVRKGGTSVLADALLVRGWLQPQEIEFSFRLGVLLQFIDDLQDGQDDGRERAVTLFSSGRPRAALHASACRLFQFLFETFDPGTLPVSGEARQLGGIMRWSCLALVCEAICRQVDRFDGSFVERIVSLSPLHPRYLASLHERAPKLRRLFPGGIRSILTATD